VTEIATLYATFADEEEAARIGRILVEEHLAACVNILGPCRSIYRWHGKVEEATEVAALFKLPAAGAARAIARLTELHSYDVPAAVVWPIAESGAAYRAWVLAETDR
jgi:periplasmic divalent cation tolerance protein